MNLFDNNTAFAAELLTVEQRPLRPLAMGHHETVVGVRPALHSGRAAS